MARCCGIARLAYNWGIDEWRRQYEAELKPSGYSVKKQFNAIKGADYPYVFEVTKSAPEIAFANLDKAFSGFFKNIKQGKRGGYPSYKKKGQHDSFGLPNDKIKIDRKRVRIPKLGWVKMRETWRFHGDKLLSIAVSKRAGQWFISLSSEAEIPAHAQSDHAVGVDVGIKELAVTSDGEIFENPRALRNARQRVRLLQKSVSRKRKGSSNRKKAVLRLSRQHYRVSNIRKDALHKASDAITKRCSLIGIEDLHIEGLLKNRSLSGALADAGLSELLRQIEYKAAWRGATVVKADKFYPSSKTCSGCGSVKTDLALSDRTYRCDQCGLEMDRDLNAAINLKQYAVGSTVKACRLGSAGSLLVASETTDWAGTFREPALLCA